MAQPQARLSASGLLLHGLPLVPDSHSSSSIFTERFGFSDLAFELATWLDTWPLQDAASCIFSLSILRVSQAAEDAICLSPHYVKGDQKPPVTQAGNISLIRLFCPSPPAPPCNPASSTSRCLVCVFPAERSTKLGIRGPSSP